MKIQKIVTDPAFRKLQRVVDSCESEQHFGTAKKYSKLVKRHILSKYKQKGNDVTHCVNMQILAYKIDYFIKELFRKHRG